MRNLLALISVLSFLSCTAADSDQHGDWVFVSKSSGRKIQISESEACRKRDFPVNYIKDNCESERFGFKCKGDNKGDLILIGTFKSEEDCKKRLEIAKHALKTNPEFMSGCYCIAKGSAEAFQLEASSKQECLKLVGGEVFNKSVSELSKTGGSCFFDREKLADAMKVIAAPSVNK